MQRHQQGVMISKLNAMQRNLFKEQIILDKINLKLGLAEQYDVL